LRRNDEISKDNETRMTIHDVIDRLAGIGPDSPLDALRNEREEARRNAQKSYEALFAPTIADGVTLKERHAVAAFVAGLHRDAEALAFYRDALAAHDPDGLLAKAVDKETARGLMTGPYGRYPNGPLNVESKFGPDFRVSPSTSEALGRRLAAALAHAHFLVFHPRDASPGALKALAEAGWSTTDIVTLSQLVAFLTFQIRVAAGLKTLAASTTPERGAIEE
jgi:CMD domain protein